MDVYSLNINPIRLGEFDLGGVLYHARYFHIYEELRENFLKHLGFPYPELVREGCHLVVKESSQKFLKPVEYGQELSAELKILDLRKCSFSFEYQIFLSQEEKVLLHKAQTKHVFVKVNKDSKFGVSEIPNKLRNGLENYT